LGEASEVAVRVVLVTILNQQIASRLPDADADNVLPVLLQLDHHGREVAVTRHNDEGADFRPGEYQLDRVDGESDVGRVLLAGAEGRSKDQVDRRLGERYDVLRVATPVRVGPLNRDLALDDVAVEECAQFFGEVGANAQGDVVEVDQQCCIGRVDGR